MVKGYSERFCKISSPMETHRGTASQRGYGSKWRRYRVGFLSSHPLCVACRGKEATVVDHIKPVNWGGGFWDEANHQALCGPCHQSKTARERGEARRQRSRERGEEEEEEDWER